MHTGCRARHRCSGSTLRVCDAKLLFVYRQLRRVYLVYVMRKESGLTQTHLEFRLDAFNSIVKDIESAGQATLNSKAQLLEGPSGVIALQAHRRKLVRRTGSVYEMTAYRKKDLRTGQDETDARYPVGWHRSPRHG
jgi:hypothetical protein